MKYIQCAAPELIYNLLRAPRHALDGVLRVLVVAPCWENRHSDS